MTLLRSHSRASQGRVARFCFFPPKLLKLAAALEAGIELSHYFVDDVEAEGK